MTDSTNITTGGIVEAKSNWENRPRICVAGLLYTEENTKDNKIVQWQWYCTGSRFRHVELYFENVIETEEEGPINVTYTVNKTGENDNPLARYVGKKFSRGDWFVPALMYAVGQEEEYTKKVYRCLEYCRMKYQQGCGYNAQGEKHFKDWPQSGNQETFFCSEFVLYALEYGGFIPQGLYCPHELHPGNVMNLCSLLLHAVEDSHTLTNARGIQGRIHY